MGQGRAGQGRAGQGRFLCLLSCGHRLNGKGKIVGQGLGGAEWYGRVGVVWAGHSGMGWAVVVWAGRSRVWPIQVSCKGTEKGEMLGGVESGGFRVGWAWALCPLGGREFASVAGSPGPTDRVSSPAMRERLYRGRGSPFVSFDNC